MEEKLYFYYTRELINENIHKFLYVLMKYIVFGKKHLMPRSVTQIISKINKFNSIYKTNIIINKDGDKVNCSINNLYEIIKFVRRQNFAMASEIIENIIIRLISFAFKIRSSEFFGKYIYNNLKAIRQELNIPNNWIDKNLDIYLFDIGKYMKGYKNLNEILKYDIEVSDSKNTPIKVNNHVELIKNCIFIELLLEIHSGRFFVNHPKEDKDNNSNSDNTTFSNLNSVTDFGNYVSRYFNASCHYYSKFFKGAEKEKIIPLAASILISSYIYHQNRHSPLMKYNQESKNLVTLPFIYELSEAGINDLYSGIIIKPIRFEPRIEDIELNKNMLKREGILELFKSIIFNKSIKKISIKSCGIKAKHFESFSKFLKYFKNDSVEELDMSSNYLRSDSDKYLVNIISTLRGLKTLILSYNNLKSGIAPLFVALKNLYKQKKTKIETLILIKCKLDDISFYELGELLKSKYCKLKCLCLSENSIPSNVNFFKALKKNKSLEEIYFYGCGIKSDKTDEIDRIISNSHLEILYLYVNKIHDFNQNIRILHRNSLVKNKAEKENENISIDNPCLYNLNMNGYDCFNRNKGKIDLIMDAICRTNLSCLDITSVLKGYQFKKEGSKEYYDEIMIIKCYLQKNKDKYKDALLEIREKEVEKKRLEERLDEINKNEFENLDINIEDIINNKKSKNIGFIIKKAHEKKSSLSFKNKEEEKIKMEQFVDYLCSKRIEKILEEKRKITDKIKLILI